MGHFEKFESYIPFNILQPANLVTSFVVLFAIINIRYFAMVFIFWWPYYRRVPGGAMGRRIYQTLPSRTEQVYEIKWSFLSSAIFALAGVLMGVMWQNGWTKIYLPFAEYTLWYLPMSALFLALIHDAYFYWMHRFLHIPRIYKLFHAVHHASLKPSPWASFSFHPVESLLNALALPVIIIFLPLHPVVILWHLTLMTITAITNHLGYEVLPKGSAVHPVGKYLVSGVHHAQHHRYYRYNYGLFFTWWDHWFQSEHPKYVENFNDVMNGNSR